jgi:hypothetical protein
MSQCTRLFKKKLQYFFRLLVMLRLLFFNTADTLLSVLIIVSCVFCLVIFVSDNFARPLLILSPLFASGHHIFF